MYTGLEKQKIKSQNAKTKTTKTPQNTQRTTIGDNIAAHGVHTND